MGIVLAVSLYFHDYSSYTLKSKTCLHIYTPLSPSFSGHPVWCSIWVHLLSWPLPFSLEHNSHLSLLLFCFSFRFSQFEVIISWQTSVPSAIETWSAFISEKIRPSLLFFSARLSTMFPESTECVYISLQSATLLQPDCAHTHVTHQIKAETDGGGLSGWVRRTCMCLFCSWQNIHMVNRWSLNFDKLFKIPKRYDHEATIMSPN